MIDLFNLFFDYCKSIDQEATTALYMENDTLHPNRAGVMKLAELAAAEIDWDIAQETEADAEIAEDALYLIRNKNSGLYLTVESGTAADGENVSQQPCSTLSAAYLWSVQADADGYYRIYSALGDGETYLLDLAYGASENGTNIGIWSDTNADAQRFKFIDNQDSTYCIVTKSSGDASCVEVINALTDSGENIQQWERNLHDCQQWYLDAVTFADSDSDLIIGDCNADAIVNGIDLTLMRQLLLQPFMMHVEKRHADTNADGTVNLADCIAMQQYLILRNSFETTSNQSGLYYAIDASYYRGTEESVNEGYTDKAYVNLDNCVGSFLEWTVTVPETGNYLCMFRTANGGTSNRAIKIEVNGASDYWMQDFLTTSSWTSWVARGIVLPLTAGTNVIRMTSMTEDGAPNLDTLYLERIEEPIAEIYVPKEDEEDDPADDSACTIYIAGDSTVQTYRESYAPQQGWGAYLQDYLSENYVVSNHAIAGRSSKSFYDNGRLDTILDEMQEGDYLLVQFAINDSTYNNAERYTPVCGTIPGEEGRYEYYLAK